MKVDPDGKPLVGTRGYMLGVRPQGHTGRPDVNAAVDSDLVKPGEGLSTSLLPEKLKIGKNEAMFAIETDALGPALEAAPDRSPHYLIQPRQDVTLAEFQQSLADTRDLWEPVQ
ncbi:Tse2 family ADP-ribosyltransferase toxin [Limnoglobus roseus]|nr:hypothetical protein [Limnoglobus roseus]